jgi:hypothetical protein
MALTSEQEGLVLAHLNRLLASRAYPKTICPSEVARAFSSEELQQLNADSWRDTMDDVRGVVWQLREQGEVEVLQKGEVIDVASLDDIRGPIRVRATQ